MHLAIHRVFPGVSVISLLLLCQPVMAAGLSGQWQIQSMGGDRDVVVQHKGKKFVARRVMWPEFEGERYKLEHLYRGTIKGKAIRGELLVKEEELPDFEVLRDFRGSLESSDKILLDGLPIKRIGDAPAGGKELEQKTGPSRPSRPPQLSTLEQPPATSAPKVTAPSGTESCLAEEAVALGDQQNAIKPSFPIAVLGEMGLLAATNGYGYSARLGAGERNTRVLPSGYRMLVSVAADHAARLRQGDDPQFVIRRCAQRPRCPADGSL